jgi:hypothetical protein
LERAAIESQGLLQTIPRSKLGVSKTFWLHFKLVLNDSNVGAFAASEEVCNIANRGIK